MQYLTLLLAAAAAVSSAAVADKRFDLGVYCGPNIKDDGTCGKKGLTSRCCASSQWGVYQDYKVPASKSVDSDDVDWCDNTNGYIYCV
ncbi:hypothetical protein E4U55_003125 [Claviceps digitariae]|nr:hypothetical protein E4U55_003125 [Claviceps digitariae]